ncbi:hypothetical protein [Priestia sp. YIM B13489]|uniref:hypothetical protein n=1 Tax=Priestia sp. YIM B13489 TaxID=3366313 RepID=UPI00366B9256
MNTSLRASADVSHKDWYSIDWSIIQKYVAKLHGGNNKWILTYPLTNIQLLKMS